MTETGWLAMEVLELKRQTPAMLSLKITPVSEAGRFDFQVGQCVKILSPDGREGYFAIASEPEEKEYLEFLIKDHPGSAAHELCGVRVGDQIKVSPAFGKGYSLEKLKSKDALLIGIGSGLSPLRSLLKSMLRREDRFGTITFLYGARTPEDIPFRNDFDLWSKKIKLQIAVSQPPDSKWKGFKGRVTHLIPKLPVQAARTVACICGTKAMQEEVTKLLEQAGVSKDNILLNY